MSYQSRRILTPGVSRKRKERETTQISRPLSPKAATVNSTQGEGSEPVFSNKLLAGYMAHEFLTKGTLFGQKFDPARAEAMPVNGADSKKTKLGHGQNAEVEPSHGKVKPQSQAYVEVASLLKNDSVHISGVVNPTQLGRWIQM